MQLLGDRNNYKRETIICFCWDHVTVVQPYNVLFLWKWFQCKYTLPQYPLIKVDRSIPWPLDTFPSLDDVDWTTRPTLSSLPFSPFTFLLLPSYNPFSVLSMFLAFHSMSTFPFFFYHLTILSLYFLCFSPSTVCPPFFSKYSLPPFTFQRVPKRIMWDFPCSLTSICWNRMDLGHSSRAHESTCVYKYSQHFLPPACDNGVQGMGKYRLWQLDIQ